MIALAGGSSTLDDLMGGGVPSASSSAQISLALKARNTVVLDDTKAAIEAILQNE